MEDIALELRNLEALHRLEERFLDPDAETPMYSRRKWSVLEWNPRLGIAEDQAYEEDSEDKI